MFSLFTCPFTKKKSPINNWRSARPEDWREGWNNQRGRLQMKTSCESTGARLICVWEMSWGIKAPCAGCHRLPRRGCGCVFLSDLWDCKVLQQQHHQCSELTHGHWTALTRVAQEIGSKRLISCNASVWWGALKWCRLCKIVCVF